jgi:hypothetical protein
VKEQQVQTLEFSPVRWKENSPILGQFLSALYCRAEILEMRVSSLISKSSIAHPNRSTSLNPKLFCQAADMMAGQSPLAHVWFDLKWIKAHQGW